MKKLIPVLVLSLIISASLFGQGAKKYVLIEHFTNSRCPLCASKNPGIYATLSNYPDDIHHISFHPPIPYNNCVFYQANMVENDARTAYYGVDWSPAVVINGTLVSLGTPTLPPALLQAQIGLTSPIEIEVTETSGANRTVNVSVNTLDDSAPVGAYKIYAAIVEKDINLTTPNGETMHHDVFRKMITDINGDPINLASPGGSVDLTYSYTVNAGWDANQTYVVVFVQNASTFEVLNSGTRFDAPVSGTGHVALSDALRIFPNPIASNLHVEWNGPLSEGSMLSVVDVNGRELWSQKAVGKVSDVAANAWPKGVYFVRLYSGKDIFVQKFEKE